MSEKLTKSEIALIESLREANGWTFARFVKQLQEMARAELGAAPTTDYVTRLLHGQRPASKDWRIRIAKAFALTVADFRERCNSSSNKPPEKEGKPGGTILPLAFWPHLKWSSAFNSERQIAAKLYGLTKDGLKSCFKILPGQWLPPDDFPGYQKLRQDTWDEFTTNFQRMEKEPPNPEPLWHVSKIGSKSSEVTLELLLTDYRDVLVTGSMRGLNHKVRIVDGSEVTAAAWLGSHWQPGSESEPVIPCARQLVVNLLVLTKNKEVVLSLQGPDNPDSNGSWATSVSTFVYPKTDSDSHGIPDLPKAASRGCIRELGLHLDCDRVEWLTVAAGLKLGSFTFFGVLETPYDREQILQMFNESRRLHLQRKIAHEVVDLDFIKVDARSVSERLRIKDYRPYLELGLALLLWLQGEAVLSS